MSQVKQIEEMARVIHDLDKNYDNVLPSSLADCVYKHGGTRTASAVALYEAGYRKQSEGEWEDHYLIKVKCPDNGYPSVKCSDCETVFCDIINNHHFMYRFCPNCGARMKGGEG